MDGNGKITWNHIKNEAGAQRSGFFLIGSYVFGCYDTIPDYRFCLVSLIIIATGSKLQHGSPMCSGWKGHSFYKVPGCN